MKLPATRSRKKLWIAGILSLVVVAGTGIGVYAFQQAKKPASDTATTPRSNPSVDDRSVSYSKPADEEVKAGEDIKKENVNPDPPKTPDGSEGSASAEITTNANVAEGTLTIRSMINTNVSGTCTLTLTKGSTTVVKGPVEIQPLSSYSSCKGWNILVSELSAGNWTIKVTASYASKTTNSTATVTIP